MGKLYDMDKLQAQITGEIYNTIIVPPDLHKHTPVWAKFLEKNKKDIIRTLIAFSRKKQQYVISNVKTCIVGEKHQLFNKHHLSKFDMIIQCVICNNMAGHFYFYALAKSYYDFNIELERFVNHCNEVHPIVK